MPKQTSLHSELSGQKAGRCACLLCELLAPGGERRERDSP